jgi:hypothetical protein
MQLDVIFHCIINLRENARPVELIRNSVSEG